MIDVTSMQPLSVMESWASRFSNEIHLRRDVFLKQKCGELGMEYMPERIIEMGRSVDQSELYYYQTDTGTLMPLVALSKVTVSHNEGDFTSNVITVRAEFKELDMSIFLPQIK